MMHHQVYSDIESQLDYDESAQDTTNSMKFWKVMKDFLSSPSTPVRDNPFKSSSGILYLSFRS